MLRRGDGQYRRRIGEELLYGGSNGSEVGIGWENYLNLTARCFHPQSPEVSCQCGIQQLSGKIPPLTTFDWRRIKAIDPFSTQG